MIRIDAAILASEVYREHWAEVVAGGITVTAEGIALSAAAPAGAVGQGDDAAESADAVADDE